MAPAAVYARSTCCAPGCPRWSCRFPAEWICERHWKMVPGRCRRALRKVWSELKRLGPITDIPKGDQRRRWHQLCRLEDRLWAHAKRRVILWEAGI